MGVPIIICTRLIVSRIKGLAYLIDLAWIVVVTQSVDIRRRSISDADTPTDVRVCD